jgi:putative molybdopterin biosynthesis protein
MPREQDQFLEVIDRDLAEARWRKALEPAVLADEEIGLSVALGRVLASDLVARVDVPPFERSNVDGFAVRASDTFGAAEESPRELVLNREEIPTGWMPAEPVTPGSATAIATGGVVPRGADAVVMIEHALVGSKTVRVMRPVAPGAHITFAGTDIARGERVLRRGTVLTARETGILAAIGIARVRVVRKPRVGIISTGDEIIAPGEPLRPAAIHDANSTLIADAVRELGGLPNPLGIVADDEPALERALDEGLAASDVLLLSGGTSKGAGDVSYRVLARRSPGIIVHGVALKPGKPICLGAVGKTPVVILPGFPTSAIFTLHEFVAPLVRFLGGRRAEKPRTTPARMPFRYNSEIGRTEYLLVNLVQGPDQLTAYPLGKGSGSVTTFSLADGFITIPGQQEYIEAGETVNVVAIGQGLEPADLVVIGSHCTGIDLLLGLLNDRGFSSKTIWVGSQGGLLAAARGECDVAGVHLLDPETNEYNRPYLPPATMLVPGYGRMQGLAYRTGDPRFEGRDVAAAIEAACRDSGCHMVNRNRGSGTRIVIDRLLGARRPTGYAVEARSHNAVAAALAQGRADWGVLIEPVAAAYGLSFSPIAAERFDFVIPGQRWDRAAVAAFRELLGTPVVRRRLAEAGFQLDPEERR